MTASEKLQQLIENDKLTEEQQDNLNDWGIMDVDTIENFLTYKLNENDRDSIDYEETVTALYKLLDYSDDDYVIYGESGVQELDFDTLDDILYID